VADTAFQNWLVAATFASAVSDDVRALLTAVNLLVSSESLVTNPNQRCLGVGGDQAVPRRRGERGSSPGIAAEAAQLERTDVIAGRVLKTMIREATERGVLHPPSVTLSPRRARALRRLGVAI
jgi:hypothetical protein